MHSYYRIFARRKINVKWNNKNTYLLYDYLATTLHRDDMYFEQDDLNVFCSTSGPTVTVWPWLCNNTYLFCLYRVHVYQCCIRLKVCRITLFNGLGVGWGGIKKSGTRCGRSCEAKSAMPPSAGGNVERREKNVNVCKRAQSSFGFRLNS